jgi:hypothetical protein
MPVPHTERFIRPRSSALTGVDSSCCVQCLHPMRQGWQGLGAQPFQVQISHTVCNAYTPCGRAARVWGLSPCRCRPLTLRAMPIPQVSRAGRVWGSALTGVDLLSLCALPALHVAAPAYLALTGSCHYSALCVVATATANTLTVLLTVAPAASCTWGEAASQAEAG